ncbi:MAG TPA: hypothetical protein VGQ47_03850 [Candidatus Limnocylindrales bacterium]|jgi:hypothetical protein|nr:hypothetical protein [Candidatus Limnocylindrales bacterium]
MIDRPLADGGSSGPDPIATLKASAERMGVELDDAEARRWLEAMSAEVSGEGEVVLDVESGTYGHKVTMLDFQAGDVARFRTIGRIVGLADRPGIVETALALSGSAAQSRIQAFPGDCDFFERVNVRAPTRDEACAILADVVREKSISTLSGPTYRLWEVKFGDYPFDCLRNGEPQKAGRPISWSAQEVTEGRIAVERTDGTAESITWQDAARTPGWCKLDWVVSDPARGQLANASNVLDVTWEAPDGTISSLDTFIDPYFQEVYLEAESIPVFTKIVRELEGDAVDRYVAELEHEIRKYVTETRNFGKAARRMYNVFRLTGRYQEAAYVRELFDEPATVLYQVAALIRTIDEAAAPGSAFALETLVAQTDRLIMSAISALEGRAETQIVEHLLRVRDSLSAAAERTARAEDVEGIRSAALDAVNDYFERRLLGVPAIASYLDRIAAE